MGGEKKRMFSVEMLEQKSSPQKTVIPDCLCGAVHQNGDMSQFVPCVGRAPESSLIFFKALHI